MLKPDFGILDRRIDWSEERIAYVRHLAEVQKKTAREIALDIGLAANQAPRIFEPCKRRDIALTGSSGRPRRETSGARIAAGVPAQNAAVLTLVAQRHKMPPGRIAEMLFNAALETGEGFCENLMDLDAG